MPPFRIFGDNVHVNTNQAQIVCQNTQQLQTASGCKLARKWSTHSMRVMHKARSGSVNRRDSGPTECLQRSDGELFRVSSHSAHNMDILGTNSVPSSLRNRAVCIICAKLPCSQDLIMHALKASMFHAIARSGLIELTISRSSGRRGWPRGFVVLKPPLSTVGAGSSGSHRKLLISFLYNIGLSPKAGNKAPALSHYSLLGFRLLNPHHCSWHNYGRYEVLFLVAGDVFAMQMARLSACNSWHRKHRQLIGRDFSVRDRARRGNSLLSPEKVSISRSLQRLPSSAM